jgi:hypothetical protein
MSYAIMNQHGLFLSRNGAWVPLDKFAHRYDPTTGYLTMLRYHQRNIPCSLIEVGDQKRHSRADLRMLAAMESGVVLPSSIVPPEAA